MPTTRLEKYDYQKLVPIQSYDRETIMKLHTTETI